MPAFDIIRIPLAEELNLIFVFCCCFVLFEARSHISFLGFGNLILQLPYPHNPHTDLRISVVMVDFLNLILGPM